MAFTKYFLRMKRMHLFIKRSATGTPEQFAEKMNMSRSALMRTLSEMKELDAPICYDPIKESYYYCEEVELLVGFTQLGESQMHKRRGGSFFQEIFPVPQYETGMMQVCFIIMFNF
ncbi:MAG: hypothetical protein GY816_15340 [Cytophagales bacterium]|nr:hypothetical protein [Cytophagales bacterium]